MRRTPVDRGRLALAAAVSASACWLALVDSWLWFGDLRGGLRLSDFEIYMVGARVGLRHGWGRIYDEGLQRATFLDAHAPPFDWHVLYVSPPPVAWLVAPLSALPPASAAALWLGVLVLLYVGVGAAAAARDWLMATAFVVIPAVTFPVLDVLHFGQVAAMVAVAAAAAALLLDAARPVAAGAILCVLALKPQVAWLVPVGLLLWGQPARRALLTAAAGSLTLAGVSAATLGPAGVHAWANLIGQESGHSENVLWTGAVVTQGTGPAAMGLELAAIVLVMLTALLSRGGSVRLVVAAALIGSLIASPYHQAGDSIVLVVAAWLTLHRPTPWWYAVVIVAAWIGALLAGPWGPRPLVTIAAAWLCLLPLLAYTQKVGSQFAADAGRPPDLAATA